MTAAVRSSTLGGACCAGLQKVSPVAVRTVGEPGFALSAGASDLADVGDERLDAFPPLAALGPAPGDRIGYCKQQVVLCPAVFVAQGVAAPDVAGDLDEASLVPPQQGVVLLDD